MLLRSGCYVHVIECPGLKAASSRVVARQQLNRIFPPPPSLAVLPLVHSSILTFLPSGPTRSAEHDPEKNMYVLTQAILVREIFKFWRMRGIQALDPGG
jgi:hypothetical protein